MPIIDLALSSNFGVVVMTDKRHGLRRLRIVCLIKKVILYDALTNEIVIQMVNNFVSKRRKTIQLNYPV